MPAFFARREGDRAVIEGDDAHHLSRSLRARVGQHVEVVDPAGYLLEVRLDQVTAARVEGTVVGERKHNPEPAARITIAVANLPAPALELVLSRCTEAGAAAFVVFHADRSVGRGEKVARWRAICREAAMLAARLRVPDVSIAPSTDEVVRDAEHPVMLARDAPARLAELELPRDVTLMIGPEGGWTKRELALVTTAATLGPRNLRADTAALAALAIALAQRGE